MVVIKNYARMPTTKLNHELHETNMFIFIYFLYNVGPHSIHLSITTSIVRCTHWRKPTSLPMYTMYAIMPMSQIIPFCTIHSFHTWYEESTPQGFCDPHNLYFDIIIYIIYLKLLNLNNENI